jgi:hypothetical protein
MSSADVELKTCPRCAEDVKHAALVCRYCGHEFGDQMPVAGFGDQTPVASPGSRPADASGALARYALPLSIVAWSLSLIPLTGAVLEAGDVEDTIISFIAAVIFSIGFAAAIRGPYALLRKRPFVSPWLFVIALGIALLVIAGSFVEE